MIELFFVIGFFAMLLFTGVSLIGIVAALLVATLFMMVGGLFTMVIKLWIYRAVQKPKLHRY